MSVRITPIGSVIATAYVLNTDSDKIKSQKLAEEKGSNEFCTSAPIDSVAYSFIVESDVTKNVPVGLVGTSSKSWVEPLKTEGNEPVAESEHAQISNESANSVLCKSRQNKKSIDDNEAKSTSREMMQSLKQFMAHEKTRPPKSYEGWSEVRKKKHKLTTIRSKNISRINN